MLVSNLTSWVKPTMKDCVLLLICLILTIWGLRTSGMDFCVRNGTNLLMAHIARRVCGDIATINRCTLSVVFGVTIFSAGIRHYYIPACQQLINRTFGDWFNISQSESVDCPVVRPGESGEKGKVYVDVSASTTLEESLSCSALSGTQLPHESTGFAIQVCESMTPSQTASSLSVEHAGGL